MTRSSPAPMGAQAVTTGARALPLLLLASAAQAAPLAALPAPHQAFLHFVETLEEGAPADHPEPAYRYRHELYGEIADWVAERPGVITPLLVGRSAGGAPIWGFRVHDPRPVSSAGSAAAPQKVLVMGGIHALEWVGTEVVVELMDSVVHRPPPGLELVFIPLYNMDGRQRVEDDLLAGRNVYRRGNANNVDLNRDFAHNRSSEAIWKAIIPDRYTVSPGPLSQPETRALDALARAEQFDYAVSMHAFGGFHYFPWAGRWERPPDWQAHLRLGRVMEWGEVEHAYKSRQLSRWGFFFRGLGMEVDHFYAEYGARSFLIEMTRSGLHPLRPGEWSSNFRLYNPPDPAPHAERGMRGLRQLLWFVARPGVADRWDWSEADAERAGPG